MQWQVGIITLSDRGASGERKEDLSGQVIQDTLENISKSSVKAKYIVTDRILLPDDKEQLKSTIVDLVDNKGLHLILTTGGTGFSPRDNTPEATLEIAEKLVPGIAEAARAFSLQITKNSMLSRGVSVIRGRTLIVNLPGSPKACKEILEYILPALDHGMDILAGIPEDEAKP